MFDFFLLSVKGHAFWALRQFCGWGRLRTALLRLCICLTVFGIGVATSQDSPSLQADDQRAANPSSSHEATDALIENRLVLVTAESSLFTARFSDNQLVDGTLSIGVLKTGSGVGRLDWSGVSLATSDLQWAHQPLISGTDPQGNRLLFSDRTRDQLTGQWSAHGQVIGQSTLFDLQFPNALNIRVMLDIPEGFVLESNKGIVTRDNSSSLPVVDGESQQVQGPVRDSDDASSQSQDETPEEETSRTHEPVVGQPGSGLQRWTVELGNVSNCTFRVSLEDKNKTVPVLDYEVELEHRARRDGIFIRGDFFLDEIPDHLEAIQLMIPESLEIQSLTVTSGFQFTTALKYQRQVGRPEVIEVPLGDIDTTQRVILRVRAYEPVVWAGPRVLSTLKILNAIEIQRSLIVRVDPPLQFQNLESGDLLQTGLEVDQETGETWRFEARNPDSQLTVDIRLPENPLHGDVHVLHDYRTDAPWAAVIANLRVDNGTRYDAAIQLPQDWRLISVSGADLESRIASWEVNDQLLTITWQNAFSRTTPRQLRLLARTLSPSTDAFELSVPEFQGDHSLDLQQQILLRHDSELSVVESHGWKKFESEHLADEFLQIKEFADRLPSEEELHLVTLRPAGEFQQQLPVIQITPPIVLSMRTDEHDNLPVDETDVSDDGSPLEPTRENGERTILDLAVAPVNFNTSLRLHSSIDGTDSASLQTATFEFQYEQDLSSWVISLDPEATLHNVSLDSIPIPYERHDGTIKLSAGLKPSRSMTLVFETQSTSRLFRRTVAFACPRIPLEITDFMWTIETQHGLEMDSAMADDDVQFHQKPVPMVQRLFGTLRRPAGQHTFHPFRLTDWQELGDQPLPAEASFPETHSFMLLRAPQKLTFETVDSRLLRATAWSSLLGCLFLGVVARFLSTRPLKALAAVWITLLFVLTALYPIAESLVFGGLLMGSVLALGVPRRWFSKPARMIDESVLSPEHSDSSRDRPSISTAVWLIVSFFVLSSNSLNATQIPLTLDGRNHSQIGSAELQESRFLIQSARYQVVKQLPVIQIAAKFTLLLREDYAEKYIRLPLTNVIFPANSNCLLDGLPLSLIPSAGGDSVLIELSNDWTQNGSKIEETLWSRHVLEVSFLIRRSEGQADDPAERVFGSIPQIADSKLILPPHESPLDWVRFGEMRSLADGSSEFDIGPVKHLEITRNSTTHLSQVVSSMQTSFEVNSQRVRAQTRILPSKSAWPDQLTLRFPARTHVSATSGLNVFDWIDTDNGETGVTRTLRLNAKAQASPIILSYEFRAPSVMGSEVSIPSITVLEQPQLNHVIGVAGPPLTTLLLPNRSGLTITPIEDWKHPAEFTLTRPSLTFSTTGAAPIIVEWVRKNAQRIASVDETLYVRKNQINYVAKVALTISEAQTFRHQFLVDPQVQIESITALPETGDRTVRFTRSGRIVTLFLSGGQIGERTFKITGKMAVSLEMWNTIPRLEPVDTILSQKKLTVLNDTNWDVQLQKEDGTSLPVDLASTELVEGARKIGEFVGQTVDTPRKIRLQIPSALTAIDRLTWLRQADHQHWEVINVFRVESSESALSKLVFEIPGALTDVRVLNSQFETTTSNTATGTQLTVRISEFESDVVIVSLAARCSDEFVKQTQDDFQRQQSVTLPQILCSPGRERNRWLITSRDSEVQPVGLVKSSLAVVPAWATRALDSDLSLLRLNVHEQQQPSIAFRMRDFEPGLNGPIVRLEETLLWPAKDKETQGLTRWWINPQEHQVMSILHQEELVIEQVTTENGTVLLTSPDQSGTLINLPTEMEILPVVVRWRQRADQPLELLKPHTLNHYQVFVAALTSFPETLTVADSPAMSLQNFTLGRWNELVHLAKEMPHNSQMDLELILNCELCQQALDASSIEVSQQRKDLHTVAAATKLQVDELRDAWEKIKLDLPPGLLTETVSRSSNPQLTFNDMLELATQNARTKLFSGQSSEWKATLESEPRESLLKLFATASVLLLLSLWILSGKSLTQSSHSVWNQQLSVTLIGLVWWIWLSPSVLGWIICTLGLLWIGWTLLAKLKYPDPELQESLERPVWRSGGS